MSKSVWLLTAMVACVGLMPAHAQEETNTQAKPEQKAALHAYRVDFAINELADGKKINARHYSMDLNTGDRQQIKIGTRVPVATTSYGSNSMLNTQFQYIDVGTTILCRLDERGEDVALDVDTDFSNLSASDELHTTQPLVKQPIIRQVNIKGSTLTSVGKAVVIGIVDDPNSNRAFQLEATVTKLK